MDSSLILKFEADIVLNDNARAIKAYWAIRAGEPLGEDWFPRVIWADNGAGLVKTLPDFFCVEGYWIMSKRCADVLLQFDMGRGALYPVKAFQNDRTTQIEGEFFCLRASFHNS